MSAIVSKSVPESFDKSWVVWTGRVLRVVPALMLVGSAMAKLSHSPDFVAKWTGKLGWPESALTGVGVLELACVALYAVPRTAPLGAVLVSAYLGGAVASHVRVGEPFFLPALLGIVAWVGLYLRNPQIRAAFAIR